MNVTAAQRLPRQDNTEDFWTEGRLIRFLVFALFLTVMAMTVIFHQQAKLRSALTQVTSTQSSIQKTQAEGRERALITRAQTCRIVNALALSLGEVCLVDEVAQYYDPNEQVTGNTFREDSLALLCRIAASQELLVPECMR